jgi:hypothetical protein
MTLLMENMISGDCVDRLRSDTMLVYAMVDDHLIETIACALGLGPLVLQGLVGGAHSAVENGLHRWRFLSPKVLSGLGIVRSGEFDPSGRSFGAVSGVPWTMPLRTLAHPM